MWDPAARGEWDGDERPPSGPYSLDTRVRRTAGGAVGFVSAPVQIFDRPPADRAPGQSCGRVVTVARLTAADLASRSRALESALAAAITHTGSTATADEHVLGAVCNILQMGVGVLWRREETSAYLSATAVWRSEPGFDAFIEDSRSRRCPIDEDLPGIVWGRREVVWFRDVRSDTRYSRRGLARPAALRSAVGIPLIAGERLVAVAELLGPLVADVDPELMLVMAALGGRLGQLLEATRADDAVAVSEARKAAVLEASPTAIVTADAEGRIIEVNQAATDLLGWPPDQIVGAVIADLIVPPELRDRCRDGLRRNVHTGESHIIGQRIEREALHKDGGRIPVEVTISRVDMPGPPTFTAFLRDLRTQRLAEAEHARLLESETTARVSAQAAWSKLRLVSDVSEMLASTFSYPDAFQRLAERAVVDIADLCLIDIVDPPGHISRVAARHRDPTLQPLADKLAAEFAPSDPSPHPAPHVIRTGIAQFSPIMSEQFLQETCRNDEHLELVRQLGFQSYITVPLTARTRVLGALTLTSADPARRYDREDVAVAEELARRAAVRIDNARLYQERDRVAHVLQQGLLPERLPTVPRLDLAARYFPAGEGLEAGGDFYDVFAAGPDRWGLVIGDVCGKGPEAAAGMGFARPALRALARAYSGPSRLLRALNEELLDQVPGFVTVAYVRAHLTGDSGVSLTACLGGHAPALVISPTGGIEQFGLIGTLLGVVPNVTLREQRTRLRPGDTLMLYTDGLADDPGSPAALTPEQLCDLLSRHATASVREVARRLELAVSSHRSSHTRGDDIAYVLARCIE
jgi:PAS domain S-box-containing protein